IARAICVAHGGRISASLPASGGLQIRVVLPYASATEENSLP
ncbi:two-component sensor histidine kinase, partial [Klebsiella michiganensis]